MMSNSKGIVGYNRYTVQPVHIGPFTNQNFVFTVIIIWSRINYTQNNTNPYPANLNHLNFPPLEVVSRYRHPQLQVAENYSYCFI